MDDSKRHTEHQPRELTSSTLGTGTGDVVRILHLPDVQALIERRFELDDDMTYSMKGRQLRALLEASSLPPKFYFVQAEVVLEYSLQYLTVPPKEAPLEGHPEIPVMKYDKPEHTPLPSVNKAPSTPNVPNFSLFRANPLSFRIADFLGITVIATTAWMLMDPKTSVLYTFVYVGARELVSAYIRHEVRKRGRQQEHAK